jgi:hypothetical protein
MITVSISQLVDDVREADIYSFPDMSEGTEYLYNNLYRRLSYGDNVRLSEINFNAFEPEDIDSLGNLHTDIFEINSKKADGIMSALKQISPVSTVASYV